MANRARGEIPAVLAVGGHDPSGGAGLIVDSAAIRAANCHPLSIPAVLTVQNGLEFAGSHPTSPDIIRGIWRTLIDGFEIRAVKTGALANAQIVETAASLLGAAKGVPLVVDPVMRSTSGGTLLDVEARRAMLERLFPMAALVTPNLAEAELIAGTAVRDLEEMDRAAERILGFGPGAVLVKGGHLEGKAADVYRDSSGRAEFFVAPRIKEIDPRGTGCALASFAAAAMARGVSALEACHFAKQKISAAVAGAVRSGKGPHLLSFR